MSVSTSPCEQASKLESARYAVIRRLGYVFRHHLVLNLQPLNMVCQVMHHRLSAVPVDIAAMRESVDQVERLVGASMDSCSEVVSWLTADARATVALRVAIGECLSSVRSSFSFRGFVIRYEESYSDLPISQVAVREVLMAALITATDHAKGLSEIVVAVLPVSDGAEVAIQMRRGANESQGEQNAYRLLDWDDVQALANYHGLGFLHTSSGLVKIRISRAS